MSAKEEQLNQEGSAKQLDAVLDGRYARPCQESLTFTKLRLAEFPGIRSPVPFRTEASDQEF